eukprot:381608_1
MCLGICCDCLYNCRGIFWKLLPLLWLADLVLTVYIVLQLYDAEVYACCTHNITPLGAVCNYEDLGGASNVFVDDNGYCGRLDSNQICSEVGICAEQESIVGVIDYVGMDPGDAFGDQFCSQDVLDEVATFNFTWLIVVLIVKCVGLVFLILLDLAACLKKVKPDEKEAEQANTCTKCAKWGRDCCCKSLEILFKIAFLIFGTFATFAALHYMQLTGHVWTSTCQSLSDDTLQEQCIQTEDQCNGGDNYYAVVFDSLDLVGPYWADMATNVISTIMWCVRVAIMRYALKQTHIAPV